MAYGSDISYDYWMAHQKFWNGTLKEKEDAAKHVVRRRQTERQCRWELEAIIVLWSLLHQELGVRTYFEKVYNKIKLYTRREKL